MKSHFNKETSIGIYAWEPHEVFEALSAWCSLKGINLKDKQKIAFDCSGDPHFVVEFEFNGKVEKDSK
jgi:hypothetical protein